MNNFSQPQSTPHVSRERQVEVEEEESQEVISLQQEGETAPPPPVEEDSRLLPCYGCSKVYKNKHYWRQHLLKKHLLCDPIGFQCNICFRAFGSGENYNDHLQIIASRVQYINAVKEAVAIQSPYTKIKKNKRKKSPPVRHLLPPELQQCYIEAEFQPSILLHEKREEDAKEFSQLPEY